MYLNKKRTRPTHPSSLPPKFYKGKGALNKQTNFFHFLRSEPIFPKSCRSESEEPKISVFRPVLARGFLPTSISLWVWIP